MGTNQHPGSASMTVDATTAHPTARHAGLRSAARQAADHLVAAFGGRDAGGAREASVCERLEDRRLFAAAPVAVVDAPLVRGGPAVKSLTVTGTKKHDTIELARKGDNLVVTLNGAVTEHPYASFERVVVRGGSGNDMISVDETVAVEGQTPQAVGTVYLHGGSGHDKIIGGQSDDFLYGDKGNDLVMGGGGNDSVDGGSENDRLTGGAGTDKLVGGGGRNVFNAGGDAGDTDDSGRSRKNIVSTLASRPNHTASATPLAVFGTATGLTPDQIRSQYAFGSLADPAYANRGAGQAIAVVIPYNVSAVRTSVNTFSSQFGLPQVDANSLPIINATGTTPPEDPDPNNGWEAEACLQLEWAHAIAPAATLYLVLADSDLFTDLFTAVDEAVDTLVARHGGGTVAMSFGSQNGELNASLQAYLDQSFTRRAAQTVTFVAGAGDVAGTTSYPATSPFVVGVGGTSLVRDVQGNLTGAETAWSLGGGGFSNVYVPAPGFQQGILGPGNGVPGGTPNQRISPDIAFNADPSSGVALFVAAGFGDVDGDGTPDSGWLPGGAGGTSAGVPSIAGLITLANEQRRATGRDFLGVNFNDAFYDLNRTFTNAYVTDITTGASGGNPAAVGFDRVTGWGSPKAQLLIDRLATAGVRPLAFGGIEGFGEFREAINRTGPLSTPGGGYMVFEGAVSGNNQLTLQLTPRPDLVAPYPPDFFNLDPTLPGGNNPNQRALPPGNITVDLFEPVTLVRRENNTFEGIGRARVTIFLAPLDIPQPSTGGSGTGAASPPVPPPPTPVPNSGVVGSDISPPVTVPRIQQWTFNVLRFQGRIFRDSRGRERISGEFRSSNGFGTFDPGPIEGLDPIFRGTFKG